MANNIYKIYDELSSEDYLCHKLRPRDIVVEYECSACGHDMSEQDVGLQVCFWCGEEADVIEKTS